MNFKYPITKEDGSEYTAQELYEILAKETSGHYILGNHNFWHGGVHFTSNTVEHCVSKQPVRCMADGEVIAFRIGKKYKKSKYKGSTLEYSNSFCLVKHKYNFSSEKSKTFTFYTLYMHLLPFEEYSMVQGKCPNYWAEQVTAKVIKEMNVWQSPTKGGELKNVKLLIDNEVTYNTNQIKRVTLDEKIYLMTECKLITKNLIFIEKNITTFWAIVDSEHMATIEADPMSYDKVKSGLSIPISAGDPVGYLGGYEVPYSLEAGKVEKKQTHVEVFSLENEITLTEFLNYELTSQCIYIPKDTTLTTPSTKKGSKVQASEEKEFEINDPEISGDLGSMKTIAISYYTTKYNHFIPPERVKHRGEICELIISENGKTIIGHISAEKIQKASAYGVTESDFKVVQEENPNTDGFVDQEDMTSFYQEICYEVDNKKDMGDGDGKLSISELRAALKDPVLSGKWSKLIAYHPTEWQAKGSDSKWSRLETDIFTGKDQKELLKHEKERITNLVFWDDIPELKGKKQAYHFHPVAFVENLGVNVNDQNMLVTVPLLRELGVSEENATKEYVDAINAALVSYDMTSYLRLGHFIAQAMHECGKLTILKEKGRGATYCGRGLLQLTSIDNYEAYSKFINQNMLAPNHTKLERLPHSVTSATWFWNHSAKLNTSADQDDFIWITCRINGGLMGYDDRVEFLNKFIEETNSRNAFKNSHAGDYRFEDSKIYNNMRYAFAWGLWSDPEKYGGGAPGKTKNEKEALKGYRRFVDLYNKAEEKNKPSRYYVKRTPAMPVIEFAKKRIRELSK